MKKNEIPDTVIDFPLSVTVIMDRGFFEFSPLKKD